MNVQEVTIPVSDGGSFSTYLSMPAKGSGSVVIVIQEIFGINSVMRQIADSYAEAGYITIAPDVLAY
jgi:carboxymethylenebutenolidase